MTWASLRTRRIQTGIHLPTDCWTCIPGEYAVPIEGLEGLSAGSSARAWTVGNSYCRTLLCTWDKPVREKISPALFVRCTVHQCSQSQASGVECSLADRGRLRSGFVVGADQLVLTLHRLTPASVVISQSSWALLAARSRGPEATGEEPRSRPRPRSRRRGADGGGGEWSRLGRRNEGRPGEEPGGHGGRLAALPGCREAARLRQ